ncbi:response regulator [Roseimarinus sediminis]|jgi:CheY-like chemotaxis protein|uniref:response regulator n=1 Tax=Roseimarinus sediminis TaxID=1610899 RepID=UPI003D2093AA
MDKKAGNVLVVEPQQLIAEEIKTVLHDEGYKVASCLTCEAAWLRSQAYTFDFFIINGGSDNKAAFDLAKKLMKEDKYKKVPFLFVFGSQLKVDIRLRKFVHPFDIISLPFDKTELNIRIHRLLNGTFQIEETKEFNKAQAPNEETFKVLLVEDNPLNQKVLGMFISKLGLEYDVASNGQMAIDLRTKQFYKYILMDIYMPGMDGTDATVKIRENEANDDKRSQIIAITANESEESVKRCYDSGMDDYLVKPFTLEVLKEKLV